MQPFERFRTVLEESQDAVEVLLTLALEQQQALVSSDFDGVQRTATRMDAVSTLLAQLDERRTDALADAGCPDATLQRAVDLAAEAGVDEVDLVAEELSETTRALREVQERNAHLVLNGTSMISRLVDVIAGVTEATYGSGGRPASIEGRKFISRSA